MSKREKIIVVVMIITALYGIYVFFIASPGKKKRTAAATAVVSQTVKAHAGGGGKSGLVNEIKAVLKEEETSRTETYVALRAEDSWNHDPFSVSGMAASETEGMSSRSAEDVKLVYSGYLEIDGRSVAIVNGIDYHVGEELESRGYKVTRITPTNLTVVDIKGGGKITVPFLEE